MKNIIVKGLIKVIKEYDSGDGLYVGDEVLSESLDELNEQIVTLRFYISDQEKTIDELKQNLILSMVGAVNADYGDAYSEATGYLWTTDELQIGNHDILENISVHQGKYAYIEIDIH